MRPVRENILEEEIYSLLDVLEHTALEIVQRRHVQGTSRVGEVVKVLYHHPYNSQRVPDGNDDVAGLLVERGALTLRLGR